MPILLASTALAASVAVLPLDGRGVSGEAAATATDTLRDALGLERVDVPFASTVASALASGHEQELESARTKYAEGRSLLSRGKAKEAAAALDESARLHVAAGSSWSRREELADVAWSLAEARLALGDTLGAREDLTALARFWPGYAAGHPAVKGTGARMLAEVESGVARTPWSPPDAPVVASLFAALDADAIVVGSLSGEGALHLAVYEREGDTHVVDATVAIPVNPAGLDWEDVAGRVAGLVAAPAAPAGSIAAADGEPEASDERTAATSQRDVAASTRAGLFGRDRDEPVRIRTRAVRTEDGPITGRWWFWVGLVALVGGGTSAAIVAAQPAPEVTVHEPAEWTVVVTPP
jgi:hypothetical protein